MYVMPMPVAVPSGDDDEKSPPPCSHCKDPRCGPHCKDQPRQESSLGDNIFTFAIIAFFIAVALPILKMVVIDAIPDLYKDAFGKKEKSKDKK